jgi:SAM-dependent methyltransferase
VSTSPVDAPPSYEATRQAWETIWAREASLEAELATLAYERSRHTLALYRDYLPTGAPILEAGCGLGIEVIRLSKLGYRVLGVDYAVNALRRLRAAQPEPPLVAADIHCLPFRDESFGGYLSFGVLEHFEWGLGPGLREAHRILRPGGVLVLTIPAPNLVWRAVKLRERVSGTPPADGGGYYERRYRRPEIVAEVRQAGFEVMEAHPIGHSFTLWGLGRPFRGPGYYETSALAERIGGLAWRLLPWSTAFATLVVGCKSLTARRH